MEEALDLSSDRILNELMNEYPIILHPSYSSNIPAHEDGTERVFRNVGIQNSDAGELPRRKHTTFRTGRNFEIKKPSLTLLPSNLALDLVGLEIQMNIPNHSIKAQIRSATYEDCQLQKHALLQIYPVTDYKIISVYDALLVQACQHIHIYQPNNHITLALVNMCNRTLKTDTMNASEIISCSEVSYRYSLWYQYTTCSIYYHLNRLP